MPTLTIRNVDPKIRDQIRMIAAKHGHSMEAELRDILSLFVRQHQSSPKEIAMQIHRRFAKIGGADEIKIPKREKAPEPITFDE